MMNGFQIKDFQNEKRYETEGFSEVSLDGVLE